MTLVPPKDTPSPASVAFGERVRTLRLALSRREGKKVSMERLSLAIGKDRKFLQRMESGKGNPTLKNILLLAKLLEVDPCELVEGLPDPGPDPGP